MKYQVHNFAALLVVVAFIGGCEQEVKVEPPTMEALELYTDPSMSFGIKYPQNFQRFVTVGKEAVFSQSDDAQQRFIKYDPIGAPAVKIHLKAIEKNEKDIDVILEDSRLFTAPSYKPVEDVMVAGAPAKKLITEFELEDGYFHSEQYFVDTDSNYITFVEFAAFSGIFDNYRTKFDEMLKSVVLVEKIEREAARIDTIIQSEAFVPAEATRLASGSGFSLQIPENFKGEKVSTPNTIASTRYKGVGGPADCTIQIDVIDIAKKKTDLDKLVAENKSALKNAKPAQSLTVGGVDAKSVDYSLVKDVNSRAYFIIKGDRFYKITINWFVPEQDIYLPAFEKAVSGFTIE